MSNNKWITRLRRYEASRDLVWARELIADLADRGMTVCLWGANLKVFPKAGLMEADRQKLRQLKPAIRTILQLEKLSN
jgi:hypothetical protein